MIRISKSKNYKLDFIIWVNERKQKIKYDYLYKIVELVAETDIILWYSKLINLFCVLIVFNN